MLVGDIGPRIGPFGALSSSEPLRFRTLVRLWNLIFGAGNGTRTRDLNFGNSKTSVHNRRRLVEVGSRLRSDPSCPPVSSVGVCRPTSIVDGHRCCAYVQAQQSETWENLLLLELTRRYSRGPLRAWSPGMTQLGRGDRTSGRMMTAERDGRLALTVSAAGFLAALARLTEASGSCPPRGPASSQTGVRETMDHVDGLQADLERCADGSRYASEGVLFAQALQYRGDQRRLTAMAGLDDEYALAAAGISNQLFQLACAIGEVLVAASPNRNGLRRGSSASRSSIMLAAPATRSIRRAAIFATEVAASLEQPG